MSRTVLPKAMGQVIEFLGELGARWGLPVEGCRVHGYLYLVAREVSETELTAKLGLDKATIKSAIAWLGEFGLVERTNKNAWRTDSDPWELVMRALEVRRRHEAEPALATLRDCYRATQTDKGTEPAVRAQIGKLVALAEDVAAIDMQARRFSPATLRKIVRLGGNAARLIDRTFGQGRTRHE